MVTIDSKKNRQVVHNLLLENMKVSEKQQKMVLEAINSDKKITKELIREIALK